MKEIDGNQTVFELIQAHPELKEILVNLGFTPLNNDAMLNTMGRMMPLHKGAEQIKLAPEKLKETLRAHGFELK